ncbi:hypothetical protein BDN72DRAFT_856698 [Pluteus cervinus]|uniref:Uncharacterized protein n=1 Tax=Pluteus cervinus TaxID=181527 RepID=A0ACD3AYB4_9AGAR|nr:hypothetical protein BDN72DRAFT_856698 [Pluteus cervinus]
MNLSLFTGNKRSPIGSPTSSAQSSVARKHTKTLLWKRLDDNGKTSCGIVKWIGFSDPNLIMRLREPQAVIEWCWMGTEPRVMQTAPLGALLSCPTVSSGFDLSVCISASISASHRHIICPGARNGARGHAIVRERMGSKSWNSSPPTPQILVFVRKLLGHIWQFKYSKPSTIIFCSAPLGRPV